MIINHQQTSELKRLLRARVMAEVWDYTSVGLVCDHPLNGVIKAHAREGIQEPGSKQTDRGSETKR